MRHDIWLNRPLAEETEESLGMINPNSTVPNNATFLEQQRIAASIDYYRYSSVDNKPKDKKNPVNNEWNAYFTYPSDKKL